MNNNIDNDELSDLFLCMVIIYSLDKRKDCDVADVDLKRIAEKANSISPEPFMDEMAVKKLIAGAMSRCMDDNILSKIDFIVHK